MDQSSTWKPRNRLMSVREESKLENQTQMELHGPIMAGNVGQNLPLLTQLLTIMDALIVPVVFSVSLITS